MTTLKQSGTGYDLRRQKTPSVADEVLTNLAEWAVMQGYTLLVAYKHAARHYTQMMIDLHRTRKQP